LNSILSFVADIKLLRSLRDSQSRGAVSKLKEQKQNNNKKKNKEEEG
jgi:hypothetical protein